MERKEKRTNALISGSINQSSILLLARTPRMLFNGEVAHHQIHQSITVAGRSNSKKVNQPHAVQISKFSQKDRGDCLSLLVQLSIPFLSSVPLPFLITLRNRGSNVALFQLIGCSFYYNNINMYYMSRF